LGAEVENIFGGARAPNQTLEISRLSFAQTEPFARQIVNVLDTSANLDDQDRFV
jgi:hypothetical protein